MLPKTTCGYSWTLGARTFTAANLRLVGNDARTVMVFKSVNKANFSSVLKRVYETRIILRLKRKSAGIFCCSRLRWSFFKTLEQERTSYGVFENARLLLN